MGLGTVRQGKQNCEEMVQAEPGDRLYEGPTEPASGGNGHLALSRGHRTPRPVRLQASRLQ